MAQIEENRETRARLLLRQRPWMLVAGALLAVLLVGSGLLGVFQAAQAGGIEIERSDDDDGVAKDVGEEAEHAEASGRGSEASAAQNVAGTGEPTLVVVDVAGAVNEPAVVELEDGARVQDAIEAAGGLAADAEASSVNRAAKLIDGQQVYIPHAGEAANGGALGGAVAQDASVAGGASASSGLVNINTASAEELDTLPGVGPSTAAAILEDRNANGPFASIEDLMRVSGIGEKKFEKMKGSICV